MGDLAAETNPDSTNLTSRERAVLQGIASGQSVLQVAKHLDVSPKTVQNQIVLIKTKLGLSEVAELVHYALKHGYIEPQ